MHRRHTSPCWPNAERWRPAESRCCLCQFGVLFTKQGVLLWGYSKKAGFSWGFGVLFIQLNVIICRNIINCLFLITRYVCLWECALRVQRGWCWVPWDQVVTSTWHWCWEHYLLLIFEPLLQPCAFYILTNSLHMSLFHEASGKSPWTQEIQKSLLVLVISPNP